MRSLNSAIACKDDEYAERVADAVMQTVEEEREVNVRRVTLTPNSPAQYRLITDFDTHTLVALGGIGSGKSYALMRWALLMLRRNAGTGSVGGIFANTYQQLTQATLPRLWEAFDELNFVEGHDYVYNKRPPWPAFRSKFKKHDNILAVRGWGEALIRSLDDPRMTRGIELGWAGLDEMRDMQHEAFTTIQGRVRCKKSNGNYVRGVTSPNGYDWVYEEFVENNRKVKSREFVHMRTLDNAQNLAEGYYEALRESYDERLAAQELEGQIVALGSGLVYHAFDRHKNISAVQPNPRATWHISFDFNRTPFSVVLAQIEQDSRSQQIVHVLDEVSMIDAGTDAVCREVFRRVESSIDDKFGTQVHVYGDAAGRARHTSSNLSDYDIITREFGARFGARFVRRWPIDNPPVIASVNAVNAMLYNSMDVRRLFIHPRCVQLRKDFERVQFVQGSREISKKDKSLTHMSDALRYLVATLFPIRRSTGGVLST